MCWGKWRSRCIVLKLIYTAYTCNWDASNFTSSLTGQGFMVKGCSMVNFKVLYYFTVLFRSFSWESGLDIPWVRDSKTWNCPFLWPITQHAFICQRSFSISFWCSVNIRVRSFTFIWFDCRNLINKNAACLCRSLRSTSPDRDRLLILNHSYILLFDLFNLNTLHLLKSLVID